MREPAARRVAILSRREHGSEKQREAVGILMLAHGLLCEIERIAADLRHRAAIFEPEIVRSLDLQLDHGLAHMIHGEAIIEQADERTDPARGIVVLGLAEQERTAPLEV